MRFTSPIILLLTAIPFSLSAIDYETDIAPIFEANCLDCHGPDKEKSGFRVDMRAQMLKGGDTGFPAIVPGDWEAGYLMEVVTHLDEEMAMPPKGDKLADDDIKLLKEWVNAGAEWPGQMDAVLDDGTDHWSFHPVVRPEVPEGGSTPIDSFLEEKLNEAGVVPNGPADARALIRRAAVTLTGLPPTPDRVESFIVEYETDGELAYGELVDELLASNHFGERWAQHWLDSIRWAETNGSEANLYRKNAWIYRDYVVRAFNDDVPYHQFITEQLAGDQLGVGEATGFLVAGPHVPAATVGREPAAIRQARADRVDEVMQTIGASMLGMTVSCARCHNHKFDPISIQDYYALTAVFQGVEFGGRYPEFAEDHPRRERAKEIRKEMFQLREILRKGSGQWKEDWGGFVEFQFPATETSALRVEFSARNVGIDELQLFGPENYNENLALASNGAELVSGEGMTKDGNELWKANDGQFGTMAWRTALPKGSKEKPWIEIRLPVAAEVSRFRFSSNREYYFETDYLEGGTKKNLPGFKVLAKQEDGSWKELGNTGWADQNITSNPALKKVSDRLHELIELLGEEGPQHSFVGSFTAMPEVTHVLHRGSPENPRDEVVPAGFALMNGDLGLDSTAPDSQRRLRFAEWLIDESNPLTARVMVNRIWHHVFGAGIVPTATDFGHAGAAPSHPELLDWLASEFVEDGWSMKRVIKMLVMTDAFQRSSAPSEAGIAADAGASLLWRFPPRRIEAEVIRDGILQASGNLNPEVGGRSFRIHNVKKTYAQWEVVDNHGPETWRRMLYQERMRRVDDRIFTAFDFPDCGQVRARRPVSTTPLQALNLMNSDFVIEQSEYISERAIREVGDDAEERIRRVFELLLVREPDSDEINACAGIDLNLVCRSLINSNEYAFLP
ncbi:MAG: PSD1 and planctomycete cytochrome C domain-containing protein [Verrucomicrobiales bacterium]|nr:PSD1 and planctomycete cytochrome C domain-containing protein [Verrucomicrobiales bacterium]